MNGEVTRDWYDRELYVTPRQQGDALASWCRWLWDNQVQRRTWDRMHEALFGNTPLLGRTVVNLPSVTGRRLSLNIIRAMSQTVVAKLFAKTPPKPKFLTSGGTFDDKTAAEELEQGIDGVFYDTRYATKILPAAGACCTVYGTGAVLIYEDGNSVCHESVNPTELLVEDGEGLYGKPRNMGRTRLIDRKVLRMRYGDDIEARMAIADVAPVTNDDDAFLDPMSDMVRVYEAWHLPDKDGKNGRHTIAIPGWAFVDEEWTDEDFPVSFIRWTPPLTGRGFFGDGLAYELTGIQLEINKLLQQIQRGHHLITGHWMIQEGTKLPTAHINNDLGAIWRYAGVAPVYNSPSIIAPEVYQHLWNLVQRAYEIAGISQLSAGSVLPGKDMSGTAIDNFHDIESERFATLGRSIEEMTCDVALKSARAAKRIKLKTRTKIDGKLVEIDWGAIDADLSSCRIEVYPTSSIPSTYAGKLNWAAQMEKYIPPDDMLDVLNFPDTEGIKNRLLGARRAIELRINQILKHGRYLPPEPMNNHTLALRLATEAYEQAWADDVDEAKLDLLRKYMTATNDYIQAAKPAPAPPPPAPQPAPPVAA